MNAAAIIHEVKQHGCNIAAVDGALKLSASSPLPDALMNKIRSSKQAIIKALKPVWDGGTLESGACIQCNHSTSSMITTPGGLIGWCCSACFDKRAVKHG